MSWYKITLPVETTDEQREAFEGEFIKSFNAAGRPVNAILYSDVKRLERYYLSPRAAALARQMLARYSGSKCSRPFSTAVDIVVGSIDASIRLLRRDG